MKTLKKINKIALLTTLVLFLTVYLGMLAQIPLGIIQVISAIYLTIETYHKSDYAKKHLSIYWIVAISELVLFFIKNYYFPITNDAIEWSLMVFFPMSIAIYFYMIMRKIVAEFEYGSETNIQNNRNYES
ncbi:hypothetical protein RB619_15025 [Flavobacterium sp. LHD-80]|uniref:hypothetical protein n=1 Tax=Flavobacterium sp. LHD-80 TaxID=3071411 RepID=UPI0027E150D9|nr:hypothetical protein [Flavobacterium sp. LHD-80]MDQ6471962.1 hypothetical protein [Flavobacterium sp. LHD-80]